jgi:hypothetical protein
LVFSGMLVVIMMLWCTHPPSQKADYVFLESTMEPIHPTSDVVELKCT